MRIGLTGGIGAGKSTVSALFADLGAKIISSDQIVQHLLDQPEIQAELIEVFTSEVIKDGKTDRKFLSEQVFLDPTLRLKLEAIIHPKVRERVQAEFNDLAPGEIAINEVPLLFEVGLEDHYDFIISVIADQETRIQRAMSRGLTRADAVARLSVQVLDEERIKKSDFIIQNNGSLAELKKQVDEIYQNLITTVPS